MAKKKVDYSGWTVPELRLELEKRMLPTKGNKPDLVKRLEAEDRKRARARAKEEKAKEAIKTSAPAILAPEEEPTSILQALQRIGDFLAGEGVTITISGSYSPSREAPTEADSPQKPGATSREEVRDAARQLLAIQPDGRSRALNILGQYGGSVSAVPQEQLEACLSALTQELEA